LIINQTLTWNDLPLGKNISKNIGIISHSRKNLPQSVLTNLYFTLIIRILNIVILCGESTVQLFSTNCICCKREQRV